jgi:hypothetical protein
MYGDGGISIDENTYIGRFRIQVADLVLLLGKIAKSAHIFRYGHKVIMLIVIF